MMNTEIPYTIPEYKDPEGYSVNISFEFDPPHSFILIQDKNTLKFAPKFPFQLGTTQIKINLIDEQNFTS